MEEIVVEGLDVQKGLSAVGGSFEIYLRALHVFLRDGQEKARQIKESLSAEDLRLYTIYINAMKSACALIGAGALSETARALEDAGKKGDIPFIRAHNGTFLTGLDTLLRSVEKALPNGKELSGEIDRADLKVKLKGLKEALDSFDSDAIDRALEGLQIYAGAERIGDMVSGILKDVLIGEYDGAAAAIEAFNANTGGQIV